MDCWPLRRPVTLLHFGSYGVALSNRELVGFMQQGSACDCYIHVEGVRNIDHRPGLRLLRPFLASWPHNKHDVVQEMDASYCKRE